MHLKDDMLRSFIDEELSNIQALQVHEHLSRCSSCRARLAEIRDQVERISAHMGVLRPGPHEQPSPVHTAYRRFARSNWTTNQKETKPNMFTRRPVWAALTILVVLALALSLSPVRAWASDLLGLFRVEKITVISFDPDAAEQSRQNLRANEQAIEALMEDVDFEENGEVEKVGSPDEAAALAGFSPRLPAALEGANMAVKPQMTARYTIDQPRLQAVFDAVDADVQIPAAADGQVITVNVPPTVMAVAGCQAADTKRDLPDDCLALMQLPSPSVDTPEGIDIQAMGAAMLEFLGLSQDEARALSQRIDWTTTLVVPIPQGEGISYQEVQVDGVSGTLFREDEKESYTVTWVKDGILYVLHGPGSNAEALQIANSLP